MSKVNHNFKVIEATEYSRIYKENEWIVRIDFIEENILRVGMFKDNDIILPTFNINPTNEFSKNGRDRLSLDGFSMYSPKINGDFFEIGNGITVKIQGNDFSLSYYKNGELLFSDRQPYPYNFNNEFGEKLIHYVSREEKERIFGVGDKGGEFNKAGRAFRIETADSMGYNAKTTDILYKHIPFYICENSVGCYGIFYDTSDTSYMDLGNEINNYYDPYKYFKTEDNALVYYVFFGSKMKILKSFSALCGRQAFPPKWSFDYCASTMAYTDAPDSENQMNKFLDKIKDVGLSCNGFYLSSGYTSIGKGRYVFNWNYDKFPSPQNFIKKFKDNGIRILPNIKPAFLESHPLYNKANDDGLFIKNQDGTPYVTRFWDGNGSYIDFTNPKAYDFWKNKVKEKLLDYGITSTWNDNNEFDIKDSDAVTDSGVQASRVRPQLTQLMVMSSYEAQREKYPDIRPFLSSRSGGVGMRRLAQTWSGDNRTAFEDLRYCHNIGLTMSVSGLSFYGHDLGGFSGDMPSRELLLRWIQHGIFEPRLTIHSWNKDGSATMPWSYPDIIPNVKEIFAQRKKLLPYLYSVAYNSVMTDEPINAPLCFCFKDKNVDMEADAMMFGRDILVYFVFDEGKTKVKAYLPKDFDWYLNDIKYSGGEYVELEILADKPMPYFVKAGCVLPTDEAEYGFNSQEDLTFTVYPIENGTFTSDFFTDDGESYEYLDNNCTKLHFTVACDENEIKVHYENRGNTIITPKINLVKGDTRKLVIE